MAPDLGWLWQPGRSAVARCAYDCSPIDVPGRDCSCGFRVLRERPDESAIRVLGWGRVIEDEQGWRVSRAYPQGMQ